MRKLSLAALAILGTALGIYVTFAGCGTDSAPVIELPDAGGTRDIDGAVPGDDGATPDGGAADAFLDAITDGGRDPDAPTCIPVGNACTKSGECCSANCDAVTGKCEAPITPCKLPGDSCALGTECCTFSCIGGKCDARLCVPDNQPCGLDGECCSGKCAPDGLGGGKCAPLNPGGPATSGNPCVTDLDCASKFCKGGICVNPSFCVQLNDVCATNSECCGGVCQKAPGSLLGICKLTAATGVGGCDIAGTVCATTSDAGVDGGSLACGGNCCSRSCAPYAPSGVKVCQPASGCRVNGDLCRVDSDCCGWSGAPAPVKGPVTCSKATPTQEFGRCDNGGSCREAGSICGKVEGGSCNAENNCCDPIGAPSNLCNATPEKCCVRDTLGVPRCILKVTDCTAAPPPAGSPCATSADCCGKPCVSNVCGGTCVPAGGLCTSNADCCPGLPCAIPPGGLFGFCGGTVLADGGVSPDGGTTAPDGGPCALYGQACTTSGECCAGVPCTSGTCRFP